MRIKNLLYITPNYPMQKFPERGVFVETLVRGWRKLGVETDVIAPTSLSLAIRSMTTRRSDLAVAARSVVRPTYITLSNRKIGFIDTKRIGEWSFFNACDRVVGQVKADVIIGKFLLSGARVAAKLGVKYNKPAFADIGESRSLNALSVRETEVAREVIASLTGLYCVSDRLAEEVIALGADPSQVIVIPNEADPDVFYPMDQRVCRAQLEIPKDDYLVIFVGHFIERKGPLRLLKAIEELGNDFKGIFIGRGDQIPEGCRVLHAGPVLNSELPIWLNAADVFCLPTFAEGHCNAIEEAKACGLPIVAGAIPSVINQLDKYSATLVDPASIDDIREGLVLARQNYTKNTETIVGEARDTKSKIILNWFEKRTRKCLQF